MIDIAIGFLAHGLDLHTDLSESEHSRPVNNALAVLQDRQLTGFVLLEDSPGLVQYDMCVRDVNVNDKS